MNEIVEDAWVEVFLDEDESRWSAHNSTELVQMVIERDPPSWSDGASVVAVPRECVMELAVAIGVACRALTGREYQP